PRQCRPHVAAIECACKRRAERPRRRRRLLLALKGEAKAPVNPAEQALWMLAADFFAAAVPILPFVLLPIAHARIVSGVVTVALLIALGIGRAQLGRRDIIRTVVETVAMGVGAAIAGVAIGVLSD